MLKEAKINGKVVKTFGLGDKEHLVAVDRIKRGDFGNVTKDGYFITIPTKELVQNWIDQGEENASFLQVAVSNNAEIYILCKHIYGDFSQPLGDIAVFSSEY